jgi:hypothetical protein
MLQLDILTMNAVAEVPVPNLLTLNKHDRVWDLLLHQEALVAWQFTYYLVMFSWDTIFQYSLLLLHNGVVFSTYLLED